MKIKILTKKIFNIAKNRGVVDLFYAVARRSYYLYLRKKITSSFEKLNLKKWDRIKNRYKGNRVFLIGNGPSLNNTELYLLKNEYTICFNHFDLFFERINWTPTFYSVTDELVLKDKISIIKELSKKIKISFLPAIHYRGFIFYKKLSSIKNIFWIFHRFGRGFSINLPNTFQGGSVIYEAFQILYHMGFSEIYLLGVDMNYKIHDNVDYFNNKNSTEIQSRLNDDPNHFDPRYFGKGKKYHQPKAFVIKNIIDNLNYIKEISEKLNFKIYNSGYNSKINLFEAKPLLSLFSKEYIRNSFEELVKDITHFKNIQEINLKIKSYESFDKNSLSNVSFYTHSNIGNKFIKEFLISHKVIGPFEKKIYFMLKSDNCGN